MFGAPGGVGGRTVDGRQGLIHTYLSEIVIVKLHMIIVIEPQLVGKRAEHSLEERVDGRYIEVAVIVEQNAQGRAAGTRYVSAGGQ